MPEAFSKPRPGDIELTALVLSNFDGSESWDVRHIALEFNVYESLDQDYLRADLVINDSLSLIGRMPIVGEEKLQLTFKTPSEYPDSGEYRTIELNLVAVKCTNLQYMNTRSELFKMEFVSGSFFQDARGMVQDLLEGTVQSMVQKVGQEHLGLSGSGSSQDSLTVGPTVGFHTFVIPSLSPFETMKFLASEAQGTYQGSNFLFFHGTSGAQFVESESLITSSLKDLFGNDKEAKTYYLTEHSLFKSPTDNGSELFGKYPQFSELPANYRAGYTNPGEWRHVFEFTIEQLFDLEKNLPQGMYDNQVTTIDPIMQQFENVKTLFGDEYFDYKTHFTTFMHISDKSGFPLVSQNGGGGSGLSSRRYLITNKNQAIIPEFNDGYTFPRLRQDFLPYLSSMIGQLDSIVMTIVTPGDTNREVGDTIILELHEIGATDDIMGELHEYLSGKWLVTAVRHKYTFKGAGGFTTVMRCVKNCFDTVIRNEQPPRTNQALGIGAISGGAVSFFN